jgi:hypothetical protein
MMTTRMAALLGGVAALIGFHAAQAAPAAAVPAQPVAQSYADLLTPIPNAATVLAADDAAQQPARLELARYRGYYHHHHHHHHHNGFFPGAVIGGLIGGALAAQPGYYYDAPPPVYAAPGPGYGDDATAYCMQRFRSYDPRSGTYLGYDGHRHPCP